MMLIQWEISDGQADKRTDGQLERSEDLTMQMEIVNGLMVIKESSQSHRQIIRQAANAELLAADHNRNPVHVYLSCLPEEADAELSVIYTALFDRLFNTCYLLCVGV